MVKQVVRSQTSYHADYDLTKDFFRCICKRSQSSVLGSKSWNGQTSCEITDIMTYWLWYHWGLFPLYLLKVTIVRFRFKQIEMVKQVVRSQTSYHADCDLTKDFFCCICERSQSSVLGSNKLKWSNKLWDHRHHAMLIVISLRTFSVVFVKGHNRPF